MGNKASNNDRKNMYLTRSRVTFVKMLAVFWSLGWRDLMDFCRIVGEVPRKSASEQMAEDFIAQ